MEILQLLFVACSRAVRARFAFEFEAVGAEVQKKADLALSGGKVMDQLHFVSRGQRLVGFEFEDDLVLDQDVGRKVANSNSVLLNGDELLAKDAQSGFEQLVRQGFLIH